MKDDFTELQYEIKASLGLTNPEPSGFHSLVCPVCRIRKTGGFKFEHDQIVYNCFRGSCDSNTVFKRGERVPRKFKSLMESCGVTIPVSLRTVRKSNDFLKSRLEQSEFEKHSFKSFTFDDEMEPLSESTGRVADYWLDYFNRRLSPISDVHVVKTGRYKGKAAIPMYFKEQLIGMNIVTETKYIKLTNSDNTLYIPERYPPKVAIIVEGVMDAKCFPNTVATQKSFMSEQQAYHLRFCDEWLFVPDRETNSNRFAESIRNLGRGKLVVPDWDADDLNSAVQKLGVIEVAERIKRCIVPDIQRAEIKLKMWQREEV